jgi:hypothetical protein
MKNHLLGRSRRDLGRKYVRASVRAAWTINSSNERNSCDSDFLPSCNAKMMFRMAHLR